MDKFTKKLGFVGAGRTATALGMAMSDAGYEVAAVASRSLLSAQTLAYKLPSCHPIRDSQDLPLKCDLVFITVPDDAISLVTNSLPWREGQGVVHCSGAVSLDALKFAQERGAFVGGLHPLQTFATRDAVGQISGSTFAIEGQGVMRDWLTDLARDLGAYAIDLKAVDRPVYHAAAVMACGYVATLLEAAGVMWEAIGFSRNESLSALLPLVYGTLQNMEAFGTKNGASGPIIRNDLDTVRRHLVALRECTPAMIPLYCQAGLVMVAMGLARHSIDKDEASKMESLLNEYLKF